MTDNIDILNQMIDACKAAVVQSLQECGRYATGHTVQELQEVAAETSAYLLAPFWIDALETGRKPTPPGTPASDPTLVQALMPWLAARGIPETAAYAIANKIHKYGYPGTPGVLSNPLSDDSINGLIADGVDKLATNQQMQIVNLFNVFDEI